MKQASPSQTGFFWWPRLTLLRLLQDEGGQDLIEYALLACFIGVCAVVAWTNIPPKIGAAYSGWDSSVQTISSCTPDPGGGGCP